MGRVIRESVSLTGNDVTPEEMRDFIRETFEGTRTPDARAELLHLIRTAAEWLAARGWPDPRGARKVIVAGDKWREIPDTGRPPGAQLMRRTAFVVSRAGALSREGFAARIFEEAKAALAAYDAGDLDALFNRTHSLAVLRERMTARRAFLQDVERGRKTVRGAREGGRAKAGAGGADTESRLERMAELVPRLGVSAAAHIAFADGLGPSPSANRALWYRARR